MGTRGIMGFRIDGKDRLLYNHFDSYPRGLGEDMVTFLRKCDDLDAVGEQVRALRDVDGTEPTASDRKRFSKYQANVSTGQDWYALLRATQGDPAAVLECGVFEGADSFMADSLFCEYAYVINLDSGMFEVYRGFQRVEHDKGRYAKIRYSTSSTARPCDYRPVALVGEYPIGDIPKDWASRLFPGDE